ncbi:MAG: DNA repair protein RecN [Candidatus Zixiibacteriota bacterium]
MLTKLEIENVALVDKLTVDFGNGLNVVTGETGAGKSVVISALALALGARADKDTIRHGCDSARVRLTINLQHAPKRLLAELAEFTDGNSLTIERTVSRDGDSRIRMGNANATLNRLRETVTPFAQLLGQHAGQRLLDEAYHIEFLDSYGRLTPAADQTEAAFHAWQRTAQEFKSLVSKRDHIAQEQELFTFQKNEIEAAHIRAGEEAELTSERKILDSSRLLMQSATLVTQSLSADEGSARELLATAKKELERMAAIDTQLSDKVDAIESIVVQLDELERDIERYGSSINDNPGRIEEINQRLDEIYRLRKKYGGTEQAVLDYLAEISKGLSLAENIDDRIAELEKNERQLHSDYASLALSLSAKRTSAAIQLAKAVARELKELAISGARFECEFVRSPHQDGVELDGVPVAPLPRGLETARFLFSANAGEPLKPLVKTASGGELSRILLALTSSAIDKSNSSAPVLVLDEVDVGIGGQTGHAVASRLKSLSEHCQLVVITHLHQIARLADAHIAVTKSSDRSGRATINVQTLSAKESKRELERMIALTSD